MCLPFLKYLQLIGHNMLHALRLSSGVIIAVTFHKVNYAPNTKARAKSDHQLLKHAGSGSEEGKDKSFQNFRLVFFCSKYIYPAFPKKKEPRILSEIIAIIRPIFLALFSAKILESPFVK